MGNFGTPEAAAEAHNHKKRDLIKEGRGQGWRRVSTSRARARTFTTLLLEREEGGGGGRGGRREGGEGGGDEAAEGEGGEGGK